MMQLFYSPTSPYTRKVVVTAYETGLIDRMTFVTTQANVAESPVTEVNPLGKVPTLILDGGEVLYDSPVICEYLDGLHDGIPLFPRAGGSRWTALRRQALGDGIMDAAVARRIEGLRPEGQRSADLMGRQAEKIERALDVLEDEVAEFEAEITIGQIAVACALGYLDLRFPNVCWSTGRPDLGDWYAGFCKRRSMRASAHPDPS